MASNRRYRAYETIQAERPVPGKKGEYAMTDASGDVAFEGEVPADGVVKLSAGKKQIRRVAFYEGPVEEEVCLGSVEVNATGSITADVADIPED